MAEKINAAIILAAGKGTRMGGSIPKQFMSYKAEPMVIWSLRTFSQSPVIDEIILVAEESYIPYCRELIEDWQIKKVTAVVAGGAERYDSVYSGLAACGTTGECGYVFIHDSARPDVTQDVIERAYEAVKQHPACVVGVPAKDTIKIADSEGFVESTPPRDKMWVIQTPQVFDYGLLVDAYRRVKAEGCTGITDDAMIVERSGLSRVKLVMGSYSNIKITTPEDLPGSAG